MARDIFGNIAIEDPFTGKRFSKKQIKRDILSENIRNGRTGEDSYKMSAMLQGKQVERSPHGRDFIERTRNPVTGRVTKTTHIEIKTGNAKLSKLQQKTKKSKSNYKVIRQNSLW